MVVADDLKEASCDGMARGHIEELGLGGQRYVEGKFGRQSDRLRSPGSSSLAALCASHPFPLPSR